MQLKEVLELQKKAPKIFANKIVRLQGDIYHDLKIPSFGIKAKGKHDYKLIVYIERESDLKKDFYRAAVEFLDKLASKQIEVKIVGTVKLQTSQFHGGRLRQRPPLIGASISNVNDKISGTLGCYVKKINQKNQDDLFILSNNHILARCDQAKLGEEIIQPGIANKGNRSRDIIAHLDTAVTLNSSITNQVNLVDAALAKIDKTLIEFTQEKDLLKISELDKNLKGVFKPELEEDNEVYPVGLEVSKFGSASGLTKGIVDSFTVTNVSVPFPGNLGVCTFEELMTIESTTKGDMFSIPGDSGSLIFTEEGDAIGMILGGTNLGLTYAMRMSIIYKEMKVRLAGIE